MNETPKILIVDDQSQNLKILDELLANKNYVLSFANSGEQALILLEVMQPDLILLDVMMDGIDGYETCRRIKDNPVTKDIPVLFLTIRSEAENVVRGLRAGAVDYIGKPFQFNELHARIETHLNLRNMTLAYKKANEAKSQLLGIVAHELKNPLCVIDGMAQSILESLHGTTQDPLSVEEIKERMELSRDATRRMLKTINELLNMEAINSGAIRLKLQPVNLSLLVQDILALNEYSAKKKQIKLIKCIDPHIWVEVDEPRLREVLDNLISNAVKFSPEGKRVTIESDYIHAQEGFVRINVRDEGPGLTDEDKEKVFGKFQKLSARPTGGEHSSGLGLSVVKSFVELHGGKVGVESLHGQGATFFITLPRVGHKNEAVS